MMSYFSYSKILKVGSNNKIIAMSSYKEKYAMQRNGFTSDEIKAYRRYNMGDNKAYRRYIDCGSLSEIKLFVIKYCLTVGT